MTEPAKDAPKTSPNTDQPAVEENFPMAEVKQAGGILRQSKMWWVTLACLVIAILLAWRSLPDEGPKITIQFPEGHGLKTGDAVRFRGIEVGTVTTVSLDESLKRVAVDVTLTPGGASLNREGTRFWIVRPKLSLTEVSGLETAVGAKYIGVSPGDPNGPKRNSFDGLATAPPDELGDRGLDLVLQADERHGVSVGAPVMWRGVDVGQVLSVGLSPDARHVNMSVRINGTYRKLVRTESKFWVTSGFGVDVGLSGLKVNAGSLQTIARGGISFTTIGGKDDSEPLTTGHVFPLAAIAEDEWLGSGETVPLIDFSLPTTVQVRGTRRTTLLGIPRNHEFTQSGLLVSNGGRTLLLTADVPRNDSDGAALPDLFIEQTAGDAIKLSGINAADCETSASGLLKIPASDSSLKKVAAAVKSRAAKVPEDCILVRSSEKQGRIISVIEPISAIDLEAGNDQWRITSSEQEFASWHGAPVIATTDGMLIGVLVVGELGPVIALLPPDNAEVNSK